MPGKDCRRGKESVGCIFTGLPFPTVSGDWSLFLLSLKVATLCCLWSLLKCVASPIARPFKLSTLVKQLWQASKQQQKTQCIGTMIRTYMYACILSLAAQMGDTGLHPACNTSPSYSPSHCPIIINGAFWGTYVGLGIWYILQYFASATNVLRPWTGALLNPVMEVSVMFCLPMLYLANKCNKHRRGSLH